MGGIVAPSAIAYDPKKFGEVTWYKDAGLRKLYALCAVIILSSATTGFDGYVFMSCFLDCMMHNLT